MIVNCIIFTSQTLNIDSTRVLIAGDSHTEKSLNPDFFANAQNISQAAEPYVLTYWKLRHIFKYYKPDTLILGFAPHNISQFNDYKFSSRKWSQEMFKRSYPIESYKNVENLIPINYFDFYTTLWKQTAFYPKRKHVNYLGKYSNNKFNDVSDWESTIKRHYEWNGEVLGVSDVCVSYLDSIMKISQKQEIIVVLTSNPVYNKYFDKIPNYIMKKYKSVLERYENQAIIFEKMQETAYPDSLFLDADHLNLSGANRFTQELITYLNKNKQTKSVKIND